MIWNTERAGPAAIAVVCVGVLGLAAGDAPAQCVLAPQGLVSWWPMDGSAADLAGINNPSRTMALGFPVGHVGGGVSFGAGGVICVPHSASLALQQFTIEAWVKPDGPGSNPDNYGSAIVAKSVSGSEESASLFWRSMDDRFLFLFGNVPGSEIVSHDQFMPGQFYHVAATYDGLWYRLFVDGVVQGERQLAKTVVYNPSIDWTIGGQAPQFPTHPRTWNGVIDEVSIYDRALTWTEVIAVFGAGSAGKCQHVVRAVVRLRALYDAIPHLVAHRGLRRSLQARLQTALQVLVDGNVHNDVAAFRLLFSFVYAVHQHRGRYIHPVSANRMIVAAIRITGLLRGMPPHVVQAHDFGFDRE